MANSTPRRVDIVERIPVRIRTIFNAGKGTLLNVSSTGAYVATPMYLLPQARVKLQIVLRNERRWVEAEAVVVWENRGTADRRQDLPPGYGLRFISVPLDTREVLDRLLSGERNIVALEAELALGPPLPATSPPPQSGPVAVPDPSESSPSAGPDAEHEPSTANTIPPSGLETPRFDLDPDGPPYRLHKDVVEQHTPNGQPGVFVLSYDRTQEARVGRTDDDLRETIAGYVGEYAYFYCELIENLDERYARECELFHRLGGDRAQLDNTEHPTTPDGVELDCPVCVHEKVP